MRYKTVTFQRVVNLGNYQSERVEITAEIDEKDDIAMCLKELQTEVYNSLGLDIPHRLLSKEEALELWNEAPFA